MQISCMGSHSLTTTVKEGLKKLPSLSTQEPLWQQPRVSLLGPKSLHRQLQWPNRSPQDSPTPHTHPSFPTAESQMSCSINQFIPGALTQNCPSWGLWGPNRAKPGLSSPHSPSTRKSEALSSCNIPHLAEPQVSFVVQRISIFLTQDSSAPQATCTDCDLHQKKCFCNF